MGSDDAGLHGFRLDSRREMRLTNDWWKIAISLIDHCSVIARRRRATRVREGQSSLVSL